MTRVLCTLAALTVVLWTRGTRGANWTSLPDPVLYTCVGKTAMLRWHLRVDPDTETVEEIRWFHKTSTVSELVANYLAKQFFEGRNFKERVYQDQQQFSINIKKVQREDEGAYSIKVIVQQTDGKMVAYLHTVTLQVGDGMMTRKGVLKAVQDPVALWDTTTQKWTIRLLCGHFVFLGKPPIRVEWTLPNGETRTTDSYEDGQFVLALAPPLVPEGNYTCRIPRHFYPEVCIDDKNDDLTKLVTAATVFVDEIKARLTLSEAEQGRLKIENSDLKDALRNVTTEIHYQNEALFEKIRELQNTTFSVINQCSISYMVLDDARRDVNNTVFHSICDNYGFTTSWYRLYLNGQDAVLPVQCTPINRCGTHGTGWLDLRGQNLPGYGQELTARVCLHYNSNCCLYSAPVTVRNCGTFFLYKLQAHGIGCQYAYCLARKNA